MSRKPLLLTHYSLLMLSVVVHGFSFFNLISIKRKIQEIFGEQYSILAIPGMDESVPTIFYLWP